MLVSAGLREKIARFSLTSRGRVRSPHGGRHSSHHKGESIDFVDFREYTPGDDYRRIDHLLWARLGTPLIREFEAERELSVRVVVDRSPSMGFYEKHPAALRLAGLMTYLALAGGDRVELWAAPGEGGGRAVTRGRRGGTSRPGPGWRPGWRDWASNPATAGWGLRWRRWRPGAVITTSPW